MKLLKLKVRHLVDTQCQHKYYLLAIGGAGGVYQTFVAINGECQGPLNTSATYLGTWDNQNPNKVLYISDMATSNAQGHKFRVIEWIEIDVGCTYIKVHDAHTIPYACP